MSGEQAKIHFVLAHVLSNVHKRLIEVYGGLPGVRDEDAFLSAVARPENLAAYAGEAGLPALAAALPWIILLSRPFVDGNKRTAFAALMIFLERNGWRLACSEVEETAMVLRAAAREITEAEWVAWVQRVAEAV